MKKPNNLSTLRTRRHDAIMDAVARRLMNDDQATWGDVEKYLKIPSSNLGTQMEQDVLKDLGFKIKQIERNIEANELRHEYAPAADLIKINKDYPLLARGAASPNYKKKKR